MTASTVWMNCCTRLRMAPAAEGGGAEGALLAAPALGPTGLTEAGPEAAAPPPPVMLLYWLARFWMASMVPWGGEPPALMPAAPASALMPPPTALAAGPVAPWPKAW